MSSDTLSEYGVIPESDAYRSVGDRLAAQQRERQAQAAEWEKQRDAGRAWAYQRAGLPVPEGDAPDGWEARLPCEDRPQTPNDPRGGTSAHAPEPAVIARAMAVYRLACAVETAADAIASLTDRVAALEAANARREREAAPRAFAGDQKGDHP